MEEGPIHGAEGPIHGAQLSVSYHNLRDIERGNSTSKSEGGGGLEGAYAINYIYICVIINRRERRGGKGGCVLRYNNVPIEKTSIEPHWMNTNVYHLHYIKMHRYAIT